MGGQSPAGNQIRRQIDITDTQDAAEFALLDLTAAEIVTSEVWIRVLVLESHARPKMVASDCLAETRGCHFAAAVEFPRCHLAQPLAVRIDPAKMYNRDDSDHSRDKHPQHL